MKRAIVLSLCAVAALGGIPAHGAVLTTVKGGSMFTLDRVSQDPLVYDKLSVSFSDARAQTAAEYPPLGAGAASVSFTPFSGPSTTVPLNLYSMTVAEAESGATEITFSGLSADGRCFTGHIASDRTGTSAPAKASLSFGPAPCLELPSTFEGAGNTSFTYSETG